MREGPELLDFSVDEVAEELAPDGCGALLARATLRVPGLRVVAARPAGGHRHRPFRARHCDLVPQSDRLPAGLGPGRAGPGCPAEGAAAGEVDPHRPALPGTAEFLLPACHPVCSAVQPHLQALA